MSVNIKEASLQNIRDALAGAFSLNVIHEPAILWLNKYGLLIDKFNGSSFQQKTLKYMLKRNQRIWGIAETPLFILKAISLLDSKLKYFSVN